MCIWGLVKVIWAVGIHRTAAFSSSKGAYSDCSIVIPILVVVTHAVSVSPALWSFTHLNVNKVSDITSLSREVSESAESYIGTNWREFVQELYASLFKYSRADIVKTLSCWGDFLSKCWVRQPYWIQWNPLTRMSKAQSRNISLVIDQPTREDLWVGSLQIHKTISALIFADNHGCHWLFTLKPRESLAVISEWRPS